jgi:DNA polymerase-3 subunit delta
MTAIQAKNVDAFLARPNPAQPVVLVYGPDSGLVHERAAALVRASVDDVNDPFSLARLEGDELASEPSRLVEEANTIPLFGGKRAVWVKAGARNFAPAVEALVANASADCRVVIEAGELRKTAPLRTICEKAKNAAALPCYEDDEQALDRLIDAEMREAGLTIAPEARAMLLPLLGGDRLASRSEIGKLALYARGKARIEIDDVMAVVSDASALALDELIDAAFAGKTADVETLFAKARNAGTTPGAILFAASRHVSALHKARVAVEAGQPAAGAVGGMWLHFSRQAKATAALNAWTSGRLASAMTQIADVMLETRKRADLAEPSTHRALMSIALNARRTR